MGDNMANFGYLSRKSSNYFEGWYFKCTDSSSNTTFALIFAVTFEGKNPHSFIQFINGKTNESFYFSFSINQFKYLEETNVVYIGENYISENEVYFKNKEIEFRSKSLNNQPLQTYQNTTSAMGFLSKAPLECFQEVVFMKATVEFEVTIKEQMRKYKGLSYMEKTYGTNFPSKWIWFQSNYSQNNSSISFSVGIVPFLLFRVKGFFMVLHFNGVEERFGSFNLSKIKVEEISSTSSKLIISKRKLRIELIVDSLNTIPLVGPRKGGIMDLEVIESINSSGYIKIYKKGKLIFEDSYINSGLELMFS